MKNRYFFITFEGIDGSGKSTQMYKLLEYIRNNDDYPFGNKYSNIWLTREPTDITKYGRKIIKLIKSEKLTKEEAFEFYIKDRIEHSRLIKKYLNKSYVVCSRFDISTFAYQHVQGYSYEDIYNAHGFDKGMSQVPDLTIIVDIDPEMAFERCNSRGEDSGFFEKKEFLIQAAKAQLDAVKWWQKYHPERKFVIVNGNLSIEEVTKDMLEKIAVDFMEIKK